MRRTGGERVLDPRLVRQAVAAIQPELIAAYPATPADVVREVIWRAALELTHGAPNTTEFSRRVRQRASGRLSAANGRPVPIRAVQATTAT